MSLSLLALLSAVAIVGGLLAYMLSQKPVTTAQQLIQQQRYAEAVEEARRSGDQFHAAEALKLSGKFVEAIEAYRRSSDPAAREGIALCLAYLLRDLDEARRLMETQIAQYPQIQEFQSLALAYILLQSGDRDAALRLYRDNIELLETRFHDDYTDRDPLLSETLYHFSVLADANEEHARADSLRRQAREWGWTIDPASS